jgi:hypothetical protein
MATATFDNRTLVEALQKALRHGTGVPEWVATRDVKKRLLDARISLSYSSVADWLDHLVSIGKCTHKKQGALNLYRLVTGDGSPEGKEVMDQETPEIKETVTPPGGQSLATASPIMAVEALFEREQQIKEIIDRFFEMGKHFGPAFPGAKNNSLYKLGAEWLAAAFHIVPEYDVIRRVINPERGALEATYEVRCNLSASQGGEYRLIGSAIGVCTSEEDRYKYRKNERVCPSCGEATVFKSKKNKEWFCWKKKGGCGDTFPPNDPAIVDQETGRIINEDILGLQHTILAMAEKRAFVLAIRTATGVSAYFDDVVPDDDTLQYAKPGDAIPPRQDNRPQANGNGGAFRPNQIQALIDHALTSLPTGSTRQQAGGECLEALKLKTWGDTFIGSYDEAKIAIDKHLRQSIADSPNPDEPPLWVINDDELKQLIQESAQVWGTTSKTSTRKHLIAALGLNGNAKNDSELAMLISSAYHGDHGTAMQAVSLYEVAA